MPVCVADVAHEVDDDVDVGDDILEPRRGVVDDDGGAELAQPRGVARRGGRGDVRAEVRGELHGEVPDAAAAGMDEDPLAFVGVRGLDDESPRGERGERHARGLDVRQRSGLAGDRQRRDDRVLGVAAARARERGMPNTGGARGAAGGTRRGPHDDTAEVVAEHRG